MVELLRLIVRSVSSDVCVHMCYYDEIVFLLSHMAHYWSIESYLFLYRFSILTSLPFHFILFISFSPVDMCNSTSFF